MLTPRLRPILDDHLDTTAGVKNLWTFVLLDGPIVRAIKGIGLDPAAIEQFHRIIREQIAADYTQQEYDAALLQGVYAHDTATLASLGTTYWHRPVRPTRQRGRRRKR